MQMGYMNIGNVDWDNQGSEKDKDTMMGAWRKTVE